MKMTMYPHCLHTSTINELIIFLRIIILYFRIILRKRNSIPSTPLYRYHSATVSAWSFHPVLPGLILIPTALFLLMALSVFWFFCMSLAFMPVCRAYGAFSLCIIYLFSNSKVIPSSFLSSISNPFLLSIYSFINFLSEA